LQTEITYGKFVLILTEVKAVNDYVNVDVCVHVHVNVDVLLITKRICAPTVRALSKPNLHIMAYFHALRLPSILRRTYCSEWKRIGSFYWVRRSERNYPEKSPAKGRGRTPTDAGKL